MKKYIISLFLISVFCFPQLVYAENIVPVNSTIKTVYNSLDFAKSYKTTSENLLYLLLSAINEYNYSIEEIQFKTGSVLFKAYSKEFIASVSAQDSANSYVKIIPADNNYNFSPLLLQRLHNYIEVNNTAIFQSIL